MQTIPLCRIRHGTFSPIHILPTRMRAEETASKKDHHTTRSEDSKDQKQRRYAHGSRAYGQLCVDERTVGTVSWFFENGFENDAFYSAERVEEGFCEDQLNLNLLALLQAVLINYSTLILNSVNIFMLLTLYFTCNLSLVMRLLTNMSNYIFNFKYNKVKTNKYLFFISMPKHRQDKVYQKLNKKYFKAFYLISKITSIM